MIYYKVTYCICGYPRMLIDTENTLSSEGTERIDYP